MHFKQIISDYFTFSRGERKGIIILIVIIFILGVVNKFYFYFETPARIDPELFDSVCSKLDLFDDSLKIGESGQTLFAFNPNIIDSVSLDSLNLSKRVKQNLIRFRKRGGVFHFAEDFRKLYGLSDLEYYKIKPFLVVENRTSAFVPNKNKVELFRFDPNIATDHEFLLLGFSEKQISTIRNYMAKGGHFYNKKDFFKIWGLKNDQKRHLADYVDIHNMIIRYYS